MSMVEGCMTADAIFWSAQGHGNFVAALSEYYRSPGSGSALNN
jgi:hypothetical protein